MRHCQCRSGSSRVHARVPTRRQHAPALSTLSQRLFPADSQAINSTLDWAHTATLAPSDSLEVLTPPAQDAEEQEGRPGKWVRGVSCPLQATVSAVGAPICARAPLCGAHSLCAFLCVHCAGEAMRSGHRYGCGACPAPHCVLWRMPSTAYCFTLTVCCVWHPPREPEPQPEP